MFVCWKKGKIAELRSGVGVCVCVCVCVPGGGGGGGFELIELID